MLIFLEGQRNMMFSGKDVVKEGTFIVPAQVEEEALYAKNIPSDCYSN